jgi:hypothetical protein
MAAGCSREGCLRVQQVGGAKRNARGRQVSVVRVSAGGYPPGSVVVWPFAVGRLFLLEWSLAHVQGWDCVCARSYWKFTGVCDTFSSCSTKLSLSDPLDLFSVQVVSSPVIHRGQGWYTEGKEGMQRARRVCRGYTEGKEGMRRAMRVCGGQGGYAEGKEGTQRARRVRRGQGGYAEGKEGMQRARRVRNGQGGYAEGKEGTWRATSGKLVLALLDLNGSKCK